MEKLGIEMRRDELVIAEQNYDGVDCFQALETHENEMYSISDELLQLLNVLYKDRKSKGDRLPKYIEKKGREITRKIEDFLDEERYQYQILRDIADHLNAGELIAYFDELGMFIKFQKSFRLLNELDDNKIIYELVHDESTGKITAVVNSYSVLNMLIRYLVKIM